MNYIMDPLSNLNANNAFVTIIKDTYVKIWNVVHSNIKKLIELSVVVLIWSIIKVIYWNVLIAMEMPSFLIGPSFGISVLFFVFLGMTYKANSDFVKNDKNLIKFGKLDSNTTTDLDKVLEKGNEEIININRDLAESLGYISAIGEGLGKFKRAWVLSEIAISILLVLTHISFI